MPNHFNNQLVIIADSEHHDAILKLISSNPGLTPPQGEDCSAEFRCLDFNKIIPMPTIFKNWSSGSNEIDGVSVNHWETINGKEVAISNDVLEKMQKEHGAVGWYDWSVINWGTKWNAYYCQGKKYLDSIFIDFHTAYSPPEPVYVKMSEILHKEVPEIELYARGVDEGYDYDDEDEVYYWAKNNHKEFWSINIKPGENTN